MEQTIHNKISRDQTFFFLVLLFITTCIYIFFVLIGNDKILLKEELQIVHKVCTIELLNNYIIMERRQSKNKINNIRIRGKTLNSRPIKKSRRKTILKLAIRT